MESGYISYRSSRIFYIRTGRGAKHLLAFHGFNENAESFLVLESSLGRHFTITAFDIPWHGRTEWAEVAPFAPEDLMAIVEKYLRECGIGRFSVLGFSLGGKCALYVAESFAPRLETLFLFAADGIRTNRIYDVAVYPAWGRQLFHTTIRHPGWFFLMIRCARALKLISPWLYKFTSNHMQTREQRKRLYLTWMSMAAFKPDIPGVQDALRKSGTQVILVFGLRDEVIPVRAGALFAQGLPVCRLYRIDRGHYFIDQKLNPVLEEILNEL